jgi:hypothetical protein
MCTLPDIHAGGIEQQNGRLYVADSRKSNDRIIEFDIVNDLYEVPSHFLDAMFGFRYLLRQSASFASPTKPSFLSYDVDNEKFVIGTYARCGPKIGIHLDSQDCLTRLENRLVWFDPKFANSNSLLYSNTTTKDSFQCWHYFSEMQGAASARIGNDTILWVSSSYGPIADSHLHVINMTSTFTGECLRSQQLDDIVDMMKVTIFRYPPGLEDLHIEQFDGVRYMWMVTEFGTRTVFATSLVDILP